MVYNLFLDDVRNPEDAFWYMHLPIYNQLKWEVVRSYDEFVKIIEEKGLPMTLSIDHDLADFHYKTMNHGDTINYDNLTEKTGYDCAKWLVDYCVDNKLTLPKDIYIHSMNPVGRKNIQMLFINFNNWSGA